jgi:predicted PurR-regulated permease PerM
MSEPESRINLDTECMERLADTFENSAKRWELIVYPSLVAFIVLAVYGFYLVYTLSRDVHNLSLTITTLTISVDRNMNELTNTVRTMDHTMVKMGNNIGHMDGNIKSMTQNIASMTYNTNSMATSTYYMQRNIRDVARPMNIMSNFMP